VTQIEHRENTKNPAAASSWRMKIAVSDSRQSIAVNFSQINRPDGRGIELTNQNANQEWVLAGFDHNQGSSRTELQMVTGNLIRGFSAFQGQGRFVNYTTQSGAVKQGLMLYGDAAVRDVLDQQALKIPDIETAKQFMGEWTGNRGIIATSDNRLQIRHNLDQGLVLTTEAARSQGGKFYLDTDLLTAAGSEFTSSGRSMRMDVAADRIDAVLELLMQQRQYKLLAHNEPIIARQKLGVELPGFVPVAPVLPPETTATQAPTWPHNAEFIQPGLFGNAAFNHDRDADRAARIADTQIILDVGAQVYAFGAAHAKLQAQADGSWHYKGKTFEFSYAPGTDRFSVSDLTQGTVIAASIANVVTTDNEIEPTMLERFERLGEAMNQPGGSPTQAPRQSYEQSMARENSQPVTSADLVTWQQQATAIGRSAEYRVKLAQTAATSQETGTLTKAANKARLIDQRQWQQQVTGMAEHAQSIVQSAGVPTASGRAFAGSMYRIVAEGSHLSVHAKERGVILAVEQGQVVTASINQQDAERFAKQATALRRDRPNQVAGMEH
jgi:hypothetical protein